MIREQDSIPIRLLKILLALAILFCVVKHGIYRPWAWPASDFEHYYSHAIDLRIGKNPYFFYSPPPAVKAGYVYPLFLMSLLVPLTTFVYPVAVKIWWAFNLTLLGAGGVMAWRYLSSSSGPGPLGRYGLRPFIAFLLPLAFMPAMNNLVLGQANFPVVMALAVSMCLASRGRRIAAGIVFALAVLMKAQPIVLLPAMALALGWRGFFATAAMGAAYLATLGVTGLWRYEWYHWTEKMPYWSQRPDLPTFAFYRMMVDHGVQPAVALARAPFIEGAVAFVMLGGILGLWLRKAPPLWIVAWALIASLPMSRFLEFHHLVQLLIPAVMLFRHGEDTGKVFYTVAALGGFLLVNVGWYIADHYHFLTGPFFYHGAILLLAVGVLAAGVSAKKS